MLRTLLRAPTRTLRLRGGGHGHGNAGHEESARLFGEPVSLPAVSPLLVPTLDSSTYCLLLLSTLLFNCSHLLLVLSVYGQTGKPLIMLSLRVRR